LYSKDVVVLHPNDNVVVCLRELESGSLVRSRRGDDSESSIRCSECIPRGHKVAIEKIRKSEVVRKFGLPIGVATKHIEPGDHVHEHNMRTGLDESEYPDWQSTQTRPSKTGAETSIDFHGYTRGGRAAARNEIWIVNTVACVNQTASRLAERANRELANVLPNVDGFFAFPHPYGCSQLGDDLSDTQKILAGLINHPHAGGVLVLGLGCENNRMENQIKQVDKEKLERVVFFNTQDVGDEMEDGFAALEKLADLLNKETRTTVPASQLILGMKCGGSDGFSGITANPLLGRISDRHCQAGGTVLLTEVPEMFGAESVLLNRCAHQHVHEELCRTIEDFKQYFRDHHQPISENPSPGNRDGGITTLEEKSLGCVQKGGVTAPIKQIVPYGGLAEPGLGGIALINGPGNDGVSTTALTCAGANVILFTTGRGTPLGAPVPTLKISSNSQLAEKKPGWIDFDAGRLVDGVASLDELAEQLYKQIIQIASGESYAKNETNGYREIAIWKTGVTL